jgi:hypothetical protein
MKADNFDTSSTGVSIELYLDRDEDLARYEFEDNITPLTREVYRGRGIYWYGSSDPAPTNVHECYDMSGMTERQARTACWELCPGYSARELIREYRDSSAFTWADYLYDIMSGMTWTDIARNDFPDLTGATLKVKTIQIRDAFVIHPKEYGDVFKVLENLFYNQPVWGRLEVDGDEYHVDEHMKDSYDWDRDEVLEGLVGAVPEGKREIVREFLERELPEHL